MRSKPFLLLLLIVSTIAVLSLSLNKKAPRRTKAAELISAQYVKDMRRFDSALAQYPKYFYDSSYEKRLAKYQDLVRMFKRIESLFAYFHPKTTYETFLMTPRFQKRDFGPPFPDNWIWVGPFGIEPDSTLRKTSAKDTIFTQKFIARATSNFRQAINESGYSQVAQKATDAEMMESLRLQMVRMSTIGLSNGDFVIEEAGMPGLEGEFESWGEMVKIFAAGLPAAKNDLRNRITKKLDEGSEVLGKQPAFRSFNRLQFLTQYLIPISDYFNQLQEALGIDYITRFSALNAGVRSIYDANVFNADFFAPGEEAFYSKEKAELGKFLFFDPILSNNNERACASCHKPELAFTDGFVKSVKFDREGDLARNAPTVINAAFQKHQFWDLRASSLEDQLDSVINNTDELHSSFENVTDRINASEEYKALFCAAFPETKKLGIQRKHIKIAIATYERELTGLNSRFDQYVRGDITKMNTAEINGFNLFMGKAKCASCHYAPLFSAALPPFFEFTDHRSLGIPVKDTMKVYVLDADTGFSKVTKDPFVHFSFKIPTVRNAALTAPYMHNGVFKTLEQVVDFYNDAAGINFINDMRPGMKGLPFFMILPEKLNLTDTEKKDLVAFMKALVDTSSAKNKPHRLPVLSGKYAFLNDRQIGGVY